MNPQNSTFDNFDRIEDYLFGRMTADEKTAFEAQIADNTTLSDEVEQQKLEHRAMELSVQAKLRSQAEKLFKRPDNRAQKPTGQDA